MPTSPVVQASAEGPSSPDGPDADLLAKFVDAVGRRAPELGVYRFIAGTGKYKAIRGGGYYQGIVTPAGPSEKSVCEAEY